MKKFFLKIYLWVKQKIKPMNVEQVVASLSEKIKKAFDLIEEKIVSRKYRIIKREDDYLEYMLGTFRFAIKAEMIMKGVYSLVNFRTYNIDITIDYPRNTLVENNSFDFEYHQSELLRFKEKQTITYEGKMGTNSYESNEIKIENLGDIYINLIEASIKTS